MNAGRLDGKIALVTGSTRGLGEATAKGLARHGAKVAVSGRSADAGKAVAEQIRAAGGTAEFVFLDLNDEASIRSAIRQTVDLFGGLSILVNNAAPTEHITGASADGGKTAGTKLDGSLETITDEGWNSIINPGLTGLMWTLRHAMPELRKAGRASIINISSIASIQGVSDLDAYTATKGAINALTRSVSLNGAPEIRCNTIIAGTFATDGLAPVLSVPAIKAAMLETVLTDDLGDPNDIAETVTFFGSDEALYLTGQCLAVDGGLSIKMAIPKIDMAALAAAQQDAAG
jgi:NAD(P)-dependent dehydrogenase (short-subunit alcohol dehydrogenase family)